MAFRGEMNIVRRRREEDRIAAGQRFIDFQRKANEKAEFEHRTVQKINARIASESILKQEEQEKEELMRRKRR